MESRFGYRMTRSANADLEDIVSYLTDRLSNPRAASDFVDKLQAAIDELRSFPEIGPSVVNEFLPDVDVRKKLVGTYLMYYLPDRARRTIYILRIVYARRSQDEILMRLS